MRSIGRIAVLAMAVGISALAAAQPAPTDAEVYGALKTSRYWIHPTAKNKVDTSAIDKVAEPLSPVEVKVIVVPTLSDKWNKGDRELRTEFADMVYFDRLHLKNTILIVFTKKGITGMSDVLARERANQLSMEAAKLYSKDDFTPAITNLITSIADESSRQRQGAELSVNPSFKEQSAQQATAPVWPWLAGIGLVGGGIALIAIKSSKAALRKSVETWRSQAYAQMAQVDSYDGLLPEPGASKVKEMRYEASESLERGEATMKQGESGDLLKSAALNFQSAAATAGRAREEIARVTGGTNTAFKVHKALSEINMDAAPAFIPKEGRCFFTGRETPNLLPVELTINGVRRTVMACPDAAEALLDGKPMGIAGEMEHGRLRPWYHMDDFDDRYGRSGSLLSDLLMFSALHSLWGDRQWRETPPPISSAGFGDSGSGYYGDHHHDSGGTPGDFGGGSFDSGSSFSGGDFGGGDFGGGGFDGGGGGDGGGGD